MTAELINFMRARLAEREWKAIAVKESAAKRVHYRKVMTEEADFELADVDSQRQILLRLEEAEFTLARTEDGTPPRDLMRGAASAWRQAVQLLALPHAHHRDYREEWRP